MSAQTKIESWCPNCRVNVPWTLTKGAKLDISCAREHVLLAQCPSCAFKQYAEPDEDGNAVKMVREWELQAEAQNRQPARGNAAPASLPPRSAAGSGWVTFIAAGPHVKIAFTPHEPHNRLQQLQSGNALVLELLAAFPSPAGGEQLIHGILDHALMRDDWFHRGPVEALLSGFTEARNATR